VPRWQAMKTGTSNAASQANRLGLESLRAGDATAAVAHFDAASRADPTAAELRVNLATAHRLLGDDEAERAALESALAIDQRNLMALIRLAQLHERSGDEGSATRRWSAVLTLGVAIDQASPEFAAVLAHASDYVECRRNELADALDGALAGNFAA